LERRLLIDRTNGSVSILDFRLAKALGESEYISTFVSLISRANWAPLSSARYSAVQILFLLLNLNCLVSLR